jgi:hypothetical protein
VLIEATRCHTAAAGKVACEAIAFASGGFAMPPHSAIAPCVAAFWTSCGDGWGQRETDDQAGRICHGRRASHLYLLRRRDSSRGWPQTRLQPPAGLILTRLGIALVRRSREHDGSVLAHSQSIQKLGLCWARMGSSPGPPEVSRPRQGKLSIHGQTS